MGGPGGKIFSSRSLHTDQAQVHDVSWSESQTYSCPSWREISAAQVQCFDTNTSEWCRLTYLDLPQPPYEAKLGRGRKGARKSKRKKWGEGRGNSIFPSPQFSFSSFFSRFSIPAPISPLQRRLDVPEAQWAKIDTFFFYSDILQWMFFNFRPLDSSGFKKKKKTFQCTSESLDQ